MKKRFILRPAILYVVGCIAAAFIVYVQVPGVTESKGGLTANGGSLPHSTASTVEQDSYEAYMVEHADKARPHTQLLLKGSDGIAEGADGTGESGSVRWEVEVQEAGLFHIAVRYLPLPGKGTDIVRELTIDGSAPFKEARQLLFRRVWGNEHEATRDGSGNDTFVPQIEKPIWQEVLLAQEDGRYEEPYSFYFSQGKHTITLVSVAEPMAIDSIKLFQADAPIEYNEMQRKYAEGGISAAPSALIKVQGEDAAYKSSQVLYPLADRSSSSLEPYDSAKQRINTIGGYNWSGLGQWLAWEIDVPADGLYQIGIKYNQSFKRGVTSYRKLTIDDKVPFREMRSVGFEFHTDWRTKTLGDGNAPYLFHLTKGKHLLKLESTYGDMAPIVRAVESSILELNQMYRRVIMVTGSAPDEYRDYQLELKIPELKDHFRNQSEALSELVRAIERQTGGKSDMTAALNRLAFQLNDMANRPETIASRLATYRANISSLGDWIYTVGNMPLQIDYLIVADPGRIMPAAEKGFLDKLKHQAGLFLLSFVNGDSSLGSTSIASKTQALKVWITAGLDQAKIVKRMLENSFTPQTGIAVDLQVVTPTVLQQATLAGEGPDIALPVSNDLPINFATRNAVQDLSEFPGFAEVRKRFHESAFVPYAFNGGYYGLPVGQSFPVLFYRKDILDELHIRIPETWQDVYEVLAELQKQHLQFGFPRGLSPNPVFATMLLQAGGQFYKDGGKASDLDSENSIKAFQQWTELYTAYKLPLEIDFANRFRTGEIPIGIDNYTTFNTISVIAPELKGLWGFALVPGIVDSVGNLHREVPGTGSAAIMLKSSKIKDRAWEFLKWWSDREQQAKYGREVEAVLGPAARSDTANVEALGKLPWSKEQYEILMEQWKWVEGIPEVPGGYFTGRHLENAFLNVALSGKDPRETIKYYVRFMNDEIKLKRKEFGLP